jgi:hypothetical protein
MTHCCASWSCCCICSFASFCLACSMGSSNMSWVFRLSLTFLSRLRSLRRSFFRRRLLLRLRESDEYESLRDEDRDSVLYDRRRRRFLRRCFRCLRLRRSLLRLPLLLRLLLLLLLRVRLRLRRLRSFLPRSLLRLRDLLDSLRPGVPIPWADLIPSHRRARPPPRWRAPLDPRPSAPSAQPPRALLRLCATTDRRARKFRYFRNRTLADASLLSALSGTDGVLRRPRRGLRSAPPPARATPQSPAPLA